MLCCVVCGCRFPMLFHSIVGKDERELQSPSWFNIQEAKLVVKYVEVSGVANSVRLPGGAAVHWTHCPSTVSTVSAVMCEASS